MIHTAFTLSIVGLVACCWQVEAAYPPNFNNLDNCLYSYIQDGSYTVTLPESTEQQKGQLSKVTYDKSSCTAGPTKPGQLVLNYDVNDNNMQTISLDFAISEKPHSGYWEVDKIMMKINPTNQQPFPNDTIELKPVNDIFASLKNSYSCSSLVLSNFPIKNEPQFKITLNRFQLQPFSESALYVFAPSRDCSIWLTLPQVMGFLLILFIIFTVLFGVYLLLELGNQQGDLRFSKQGGMLMNQAQLDATKAD